MNFVCPKCNGLFAGAERWLNGKACECSPVETTASDNTVVIDARKMKKKKPTHFLDCRGVTDGGIGYASSMRPLLLSALALLLCSCVVRPAIVRTPKGGYVATMGGNFAAKVGPTIAEITTREGDTIKFMSESEDATEVPNTYILAWGAAKLAGIQASVTKNKNALSTKEVLGAQQADVAKAGIAAKGAATSEAIGAGAELVPVKVTAP